MLIDETPAWDMVLPIAPELGNELSVVDEYCGTGLEFVSLTVAGDDVGTAEAMKRLARIRRSVRQRSDRMLLAATVDDIYEARKRSVLAVGLHLEGTRCMERDVGLVELYYDLGIRHCILAFNLSNSAAGGCAEPDDRGLTRHGQDLVRAMNRVGMIIDLSHTSRRSTLEILDLSEAPVMFSHSNVDRLVPHFRNITDEQIRRVAAVDGVIGVSGSSAYLGAPGSVARVVDHIDYICNLVGSRHVGIGTDYVADPNGLATYARSRPAEWPGDFQSLSFVGPGYVKPLRAELRSRGYPEDAISDILSRNFERLCRRVWK